MTRTKIVVDETDVVVNEKDKNTQGNNSIKLIPPEFISFSLPMGQVIPSDLQIYL